MKVRWPQSVFAALFVIALIAVPALALRPSAQPDAPARPDAPAAEPVDAQPAEPQVEDEGESSCDGIQRAYWAVTNNPGNGEGQAEAAANLETAADEHACVLSDTPPDGWPGGGPPPWAGQDGEDGEGEGLGRPPWAIEGEGPPWGPPPWAGQDGEDGEDQNEGLGGPPWAVAGDGPPWGPPPWAGSGNDSEAED